MEYIIETNELLKQYPNKIAVDHVSMHIRKGDIYGFIGKNGAGKTTTMKLLLGLIRPNSGTIKLFNDSHLDKGRRKIGSLIEEPGIYKDKSAYENLKLFSLLYGGSESEIHEILELVGLNKTGKRKAGNFSLGMRQRLGIAIALLGQPEILILDEPINGLDPAAIKDIRETLLRLNQEKQMTILISSHLLDELSKITTRYGIINNGKLVEEINHQDLMERCKNKLKVRVSDVKKAEALLKEKYDDMICEIENDLIYIYSHYEYPELINTLLVQNGMDVKELSFSDDGFEQYFIERIGN